MADIAFLIGALVPTLLLSRLVLLFLRKWEGGAQRLVFAHVVSLLGCTLLGGMGMADGGAFAPVQAFGAYVLPQLLWLLLDVWRLRRKSSITREGPAG